MRAADTAHLRRAYADATLNPELASAERRIGHGMNTKFLETFIWVARLRSFSAAAVRLNSTQAAVSNRISALEQELGVQLFERKARTVQLTQEGRVAIATAEKIVCLTMEFRVSLSGSAGVRGAISIGIIDAIVHTWFPQFINDLRNSYPLLKLNLMVESTPEIVKQLQSGNINLALVVGPIIGVGMESVELGSFECIWVASPSVQFTRKPTSLDALGEYPIVSYSKGSQADQSLSNLLHDQKNKSEKRVFNTNSVATIIQLVRNGVGVAALPTLIVQDLIDSGILVQLPIRERIPNLTIHAVYPDHPENPVPSAVARIAREVSHSYFDSRTRYA